MFPTTAELRASAREFVREPVARGEAISVSTFVDACLSTRWEDISTEDMMRVRHALRCEGKAYAEDHDIDEAVELTDAFIVTCDDCCRSDAIATVETARTFTSAMFVLQKLKGWSTFDEMTRCPVCTERRAGVVRKAVRIGKKTHEVVNRMGQWECDCERFRYAIGAGRTCEHIESVKGQLQSEEVA